MDREEQQSLEDDGRVVEGEPNEREREREREHVDENDGNSRKRKYEGGERESYKKQKRYERDSPGRDHRSGGGSQKCYNCGKYGHFARECDRPLITCNVCNKKGHMQKFCRFTGYFGGPPSFPPAYGSYNPFYPHQMPPPPPPPSERCYTCGESGHQAKSCPSAHFDSRCFNCGKRGHISKDCTQVKQETKCFNCGGVGHKSVECQKEGKACFECGSTDHLSLHCPRRPPAQCYHCKEEGHLIKDCPKIRCLLCDERGHKAMDCPKASLRARMRFAPGRRRSPSPPSMRYPPRIPGGIAFDPYAALDPYALYRTAARLPMAPIGYPDPYGAPLHDPHPGYRRY